MSVFRGSPDAARRTLAGYRERQPPGHARAREPDERPKVTNRKP